MVQPAPLLLLQSSHNFVDQYYTLLSTTKNNKNQFSNIVETVTQQDRWNVLSHLKDDSMRLLRQKELAGICRLVLSKTSLKQDERQIDGATLI